ncbi:hypothetical protein ACJMK2_021971 [Sinanodonta woodiana]|uniref:Uncharacterized protein n=1 Tax=Sinanodonta woodiana TaxID=1069815 RepID=A0ABD3TIC8_SINWO
MAAPLEKSRESAVSPAACEICEQISGSGVDALESKAKSEKVILGIFAATFVTFYAISGPFITPGLRRICLPFVPATPKQVQNVMTLLRGRRGSLLDIGSGDGRIVLEAAKQGFQANGVELNLWLVLFSRFKAKRLGLSSNAKFFRKNLWKTDMSPYANVIVFGTEQMMGKLEEKLQSGLKPGSCVVACRFPFPNWPPVKTEGEGVDQAWLYQQEKLNDLGKKKHH